MLGRGAAIIAALLAIVLRGGVALLVGPVFGAPINWFALYLGPAIVVELIGLSPLVKRPIIFGLVSGLGVATIGLWLESLWIDAVYHYPWPTSIWPEALAMAIPVAILVGGCGAMFGQVMSGQRLPRRAIGIGLVVLAVVAIGGATANGLRYDVPESASATITLTEAPAEGDQRMATADVQITPAEPGQRRSQLGVGAGMAGRCRKRSRNLHRPIGAGRPRPLPIDTAHAGVGVVEDVVAGARRQDP